MTMPLNAQHPDDVVGAVRAATEAANTRQPRAADFSLTDAKPGEMITAVLFGLYLGYAVGRLPEVFEIFAVPRLPMIMMIVFLGLLMLTVPWLMWRELWRRLIPLRLVTALGTLAVVTAPFGIWMGGSIYFFRTRYILSLVLYACCVVFLRDRANLRRAVTVFVLAIAAVAIDTLHKFNQVQYDEYGNPLTVAGVFLESHRVTVGLSLDPNDFAAILVVAFPLALWLGFGNPIRRLFWGAIALLLVAAMVPTGSRGGMLGMAFVGITLIGVGATGWRRFLTMIMVLAGVGLFMYFATKGGQADRFGDLGTDDYNFTTSQGRISLWRLGMVWMIKRPWGYGVSNFPLYQDWIMGGGRAAHSSWVQFGMELGVAGLVTALALVAYLFKGLVGLRRRAARWIAPNGRPHFEDALAGHMTAMLVGFCVVASFLSVAYNMIFYMVMGLATATLLGSKVPSDLDSSRILPPPTTPQRHPRAREIVSPRHG